MVFSTIIFLLRFLPITLALYYLAPPKLKNTVLFLCSLVFYCWGEVRFFPVMLALILINYLCGLGLERFEQNKTARLILLLIALAGSLGMLFYFKYANFVLSSINAIFGTGFAPIQGISVLPLGISFYTFQTLSYTIDVYRRDVETEHNIIDFGAYVVMFPQLIAGPIVKYRDVSDRLHVYKGRYELKQIEDGMTLFTFGLAKKVLLADAIGALWTDIIGVADSPSVSFVGLANASTPLVWLGVIAYSLQLYFDFSGYSLMAMGLGQMLALPVPRNFDLPYTARSVSEFYRRWHITLGTWFRDYVYIPLGGSRNGNARTVLSLTVVWFFTGLWHGASWNFVLWGVMLLGFILLEKFCIGDFLKEHKVLSHVYLLFVIPQTWVIFRITRLKDVGAYFSRLFPLFGAHSAISAQDVLKLLSSYWWLLLLAIFFCLPQPRRFYEKHRGSLLVQLPLFLLFWVCVYFIATSSGNAFLYSRF